ncbi:MAG: HEAT repeat domain-containing protein [Candidatus Omnitrophota bacterium]
MFDRFLFSYYALAQRDRLLLIVSITIIILLLFSFLFALAAVVLRLRNEKKAAYWKYLENKWEENILDALAGDKTPQDVWNLVHKKDCIYFVDFLMRYARRLAGAERDLLCRFAEPYLCRIEKIARKKNPEQRAWAIRILSLLGMQTHYPAIIAALDDSSPLVAMSAARALMAEKRPEWVGAVLQRLHRFDNWSASFLASMLSAVGSEIAPGLREIYSNPSVPARTRAVSAEALKRLNDWKAADAIPPILEREKDRDLLASSLRLLGRVGRGEHLPILRSLCGASDDAVRANAIRSLGFLGGKDDAPIFRAALDDPYPWVAIHAAWGLKDIGQTGLLREIAASAHPRAEIARQVLLEARL